MGVRSRGQLKYTFDVRATYDNNDDSIFEDVKCVSVNLCTLQLFNTIRNLLA